MCLVRNDLEDVPHINLCLGFLNLSVSQVCVMRNVLGEVTDMNLC